LAASAELSMIYRSLSEADLAQLNISLNDRQDVVDEVLTEISVYFGMLYHLIEIFKGHDDFADELSKFY
jgi:hypothetical protein